MKLTDIGTVKELMGENAFKKQFGQNFLISESVPCRIAESGYAEGVLEVGPGIGTLTRELCQHAKKVVAVEIDKTLLPILEKTLADFDNVTVISGDIMKVDIDEIVKEHFADCEEIAVCANLPYYITSPVLMKLLESRIPFKSVTVMVQKEVATRLAAPAGHETYGALTAAVSYYASVKKLFDVPAGCFMPKPKVDSAVIKLTLYKEPLVAVNEDTFFKVIKGAFAQRRKTLVNSLSTVMGHIPKTTLAEIITSCGFAEGVRGETLDITAFAKIANAIDAYQAK